MKTKIAILANKCCYGTIFWPPFLCKSHIQGYNNKEIQQIISYTPMYLCSHNIYNITCMYYLAWLDQWPDTGGGQFVIKYSCHHTQPEWRNQYRQSYFQSGMLTSCFTILVNHEKKSVAFEVIFQNSGVILNLPKCQREKVHFFH